MGLNCLNELYARCLQVNTETHTLPLSYIGLTANTLKKRFYQHNHSFKHCMSGSSTSLSAHVWKLKNDNIKHNITWKILSRAKPYNKNKKPCQLCTVEKFEILFAKDPLLNKNSELISTCRHRAYSSLRHFKPVDYGINNVRIDKRTALYEQPSLVD